MIRSRDADTICAVATPPGIGGISVIRISGKKARKISSEIARFLPAQPESHKIYFGNLTDPKTSDIIDEVLVSYFAEGKSFTGEETLEISCHGNPVICDRIIQQLLHLGARIADKGEFTYRSFMSGKIDLVQAESVLATIEAQSQKSAQLALRQLKGDLSIKLSSIEDKITWLAAHIEAGIDFSTEDIVIIEQELLLTKLAEVDLKLAELVGTYKYGRVLKDGVRIVLTGLPNVGKSSLLNEILEDDRAIVTDIPGTTRDLIDGDTLYSGVKYTFVDTAGLREASDTVEAIGVKRSYEAHQEADGILFVFDINKGIGPEEIAILKNLDLSKTWLLANKTDLLSAESLSLPSEILGKFFKEAPEISEALTSKVLFVSALDKTVRTKLLDTLSDSFKTNSFEASAMISNLRHFENLTIALQNIRRAIVVAKQGEGAEFLAFELKEALMKIHETLGRRFDDEIMDRVFKEFCIGK